MICSKCKRDFKEKDIQESHDVPCYLFMGENRKVRKNKADKLGRHWLCENCHKKYEEGLNITLKIQAVKFQEEFFKDDS